MDPARHLRPALACAGLGLGLCACVFDTAPEGLRRTPPGPGATVRYDLAFKPLPAIPLPNDTATWPDPTSRTGLRINASLVAPTAIERQARERFTELEGWGTFAPIAVSFDLDRADPAYAGYAGPALSLDNVRARHQGDDYDFANDAVYVIDLETGVPQVIDVGAGNFSYVLKKLDKYWANDTRRSERNLLFESVDESAGGAIQSYDPEYDGDFDGVLDRPNFDRDRACPDPDPVCDDPKAGDPYGGADCVQKRRERDRCVADHLMYWYERETDTLILRPLLPLHEMRRYAVVLTDRLLDALGNPVKSPFEFVYHATQGEAAAGVRDAIDDTARAAYFGDIAGTGLAHVAFLWSFTTQPTVDDLRRLRDGLYGQGPFGRWASEFPVAVELQRAVGLTGGLQNEGVEDPPGWNKGDLAGVEAGCPDKAKNLYIIRYEGLREHLKDLIVGALGMEEGPGVHLLLRRFEAVSHMVIGTFRSPYLLEGGPDCTDPNASFRLNYSTGEGEMSEDEVQFWIIVPKETKAHKQPFDLNIFGHGYTSSFAEMLAYAGNMAEHGLGTVGINAAGHGVVIGDQKTEDLARSLFGSYCYGPFYDALTLRRTRDLNQDGIQDSGGDFWSSYLFHTRDGVRQSVLDHIQLVRILRAFGNGQAPMSCRNWGDKQSPVQPCDFAGDDKPDVLGDFDGNGTADVGGPDAAIGSWGESLGGILSGIHGAIDAGVGSAVPGSGGGGLTDIGVRSFQGGVVEAVLLRLWGPLVVGIPAGERPACNDYPEDSEPCTSCSPDQISLRWVLPDVNGTGEVEIDCLEPGAIAGTTVRVRNLDNGELRCASVDDEQRFRIGLPAATGDRVSIELWEGRHAVKSYAGCELDPAKSKSSAPRRLIQAWGPGRIPAGEPNAVETAVCEAPTCSLFQGAFYGEGTPLVSPGHGYGNIRQTPALRRFITLAQSALDAGDPISFAPYYAIEPLADPLGRLLPVRAVLTLNTIGDMNVPLNAGIAFARATGALPFLPPDDASKYPEYADYATPQPLYDALGSRTPNQELIDRHVVEGITALARHPAAPECAASANAALAGTWLDQDGAEHACFPGGCTAANAGEVCYPGSFCSIADGQTEGQCAPRALGADKCAEALWDVEELDEGQQLYFEQSSTSPQRLARLGSRATADSLAAVWAPRLTGKPFAPDDAGAYQPAGAPGGRLTALLDAYVVPEGTHTFVNGEPCESFDSNTYLTNLVARFFQTDGTDIYYLSHPATHRCLAAATPSCAYQKAQ